MNLNPFYKNLALWMVIGLIVIVLFNLFQAKESPRDEIVFSDFLKKVETGEVREVTLRGNLVSGKLANGESFRTMTADYPDLVKALKDRGVRIIVKPVDGNPSYFAIFLQWVPMLLFIGVWIFFMRRLQKHFIFSNQSFCRALVGRRYTRARPLARREW